MSLDDFVEEQIYNFKRLGNYGVFQTGASFPVEYLLTTFSAAELSKLTLARDIHPDKLSFELLMQRDLDEQRVCREMEPYLNPNPSQLTPGELQSKVIYFPPLLAAIVPVTGRVMETGYAKEHRKIVTHEGQEQIKHILREWYGWFKLTYLPSQHPQAYRLQVEIDDKITAVGVQCEPVQLDLSLASGEQSGVKLVLIDGQHRWFALQQVYQKQPEKLKALRVPLCLLFAPEAKNDQESALNRTPTVPEVFRRLFVDINSTAQSVSGHFTILLSDNSIGSLVCRHFCDQVLQKHGREGLAVIEWNSKTKREAHQIIRPYSLISIGILNQALEDSIGDRHSLLKYLLQQDEIATDLKQESTEIRWNRFSLSQKSGIEKQMIKYWVPCLERILFGSQQWAQAFGIFQVQLNQLKSLSDSHEDNALEARQVVEKILDYFPIKRGKSFTSARLLERDFDIAVKAERQQRLVPLFQYAWFQRALFEAWAQVLNLIRSEVPDPLIATNGFIELLDLAFHEQSAFWQVEQVYLQHTVFLGQKFIARQQTRKILTSLLLAHLTNPLVNESVVNSLELTEKAHNKVSLLLQKLGKIGVAQFLKELAVLKTKHFKAAYRVDFSLNSEEREALQKAQEEQQRHKVDVKAGKAATSAFSTPFDQLVTQYVTASIESATKAFKNHLYGTEMENDTLESKPAASQKGLELGGRKDVKEV